MYEDSIIEWEKKEELNNVFKFKGVDATAVVKHYSQPVDKYCYSSGGKTSLINFDGFKPDFVEVFSYSTQEAFVKLNSNVLLKFNKSDPRKVQEVRLPGVINNLHHDNIGNLWVSTRVGLFQFPRGDLNEKPNVLFEDTEVSSVCFDKENFY